MQALIRDGFTPSSTCFIEGWVGGVAMGVGAIGSIAGGAIEASGAEQAGQDQYNADMSAQQMEMQEFNTVQGEGAPYRALGTGATSLLDQLYGINPTTGALTPGAKPNYSAFTSQPGYGFTLQQGLAAQRAAAGQSGNYFSGNTTNAQTGYASGLAQNTYQNYVGNLLSQAQLGANSTANMANTGANVVNSATSATQAGGAAQAAGTLGAYGAIGGGIAGAGGGISNSMLLSSLLGNNGGGYNPGLIGEQGMGGANEVLGNPALAPTPIFGGD